MYVGGQFKMSSMLKKSNCRQSSSQQPFAAALHSPLHSEEEMPIQIIQQQHVSRQQAHLDQAGQLSSRPADWC